MDIFIPVALVIILCILISLCGWCCKRKREGTVYGFGGVPINNTGSPAVQPPYPITVDNRHPMPQSVPPNPAPAPGFTSGYQAGGGGYPPVTGPYPGAAPYPPPATAHGAPYPPAPQSGAPYPPGPATSPYPPAPPSYSEAVGQPPPQPQAPTNEIYAKQSPYNPNY